MALWDAAAKIADMPLHQFLAGRLKRDVTTRHVPVYASGGYPYPDNDIAALAEEIRHFADLGFTYVKIKIGAAPLDHDLRRIEAAAAQLTGSEYLAVDAMNTYDPDTSPTAASALARFGLRWFEHICDPLDFATHARVAARYDPPIAAGEALFSAAEATLLDRYAGLRRTRDILLFDPVHCYRATCRSSMRLPPPAGPGAPSSRTAVTCSASTSSRRSASAAPRSTRWPSARSKARRPLCQSTPVASTCQRSPESASNSTTTPGRPSDHSPRRAPAWPERDRRVSWWSRRAGDHFALSFTRHGFMTAAGSRPLRLIRTLRDCRPMASRPRVVLAEHFPSGQIS
jgi:hypothetical protein